MSLPQDQVVEGRFKAIAVDVKDEHGMIEKAVKASYIFNGQDFIHT
jgi:hypothetical protein